MTSTVLVMRLISTSPAAIFSTAAATTFSDCSRLPVLPKRSKQYEWNVLISTYEAALPMRSYSLLRNSIAAAREKVSISSCSCFTSSIMSSEASLCTRTLVFPLPGPAATTIYFALRSLIIFNWAGDRSPKSCLNFDGVTVLVISSCLPLKYFLKKDG